MNDDCGLQEGDLVGHLQDLMDMLDVDLEDSIHALIYVLSDALAQATDYEPTKSILSKAVSELMQCYMFVCTDGADESTMTVQ